MANNLLLFVDDIEAAKSYVLGRYQMGAQTVAQNMWLFSLFIIRI